jgi:hypothetical protein
MESDVVANAGAGKSAVFAASFVYSVNVVIRDARPLVG